MYMRVQLSCIQQRHACRIPKVSKASILFNLWHWRHRRPVCYREDATCSLQLGTWNKFFRVRVWYRKVGWYRVPIYSFFFRFRNVWAIQGRQKGLKGGEANDNWLYARTCAHTKSLRPRPLISAPRPFQRCAIKFMQFNTSNIRKECALSNICILTVLLTEQTMGMSIINACA